MYKFYHSTSLSAWYHLAPYQVFLLVKLADTYLENDMQYTRVFFMETTMIP